MAAVLLTAGAAGKRYALPHSNIMIHQPLGGVQGQATEIEIHETIARDTERDNFMTAEMAKNYGLIDQILTRNDLHKLTAK